MTLNNEKLFDYDLLTSDDLLEKANLALKNSEFNSAINMFSILLQREPENIKAQVGLALANSSVAGIENITPEYFVEKSCSPRCKDIKADCDESLGECFDIIDECVSLGFEIRNTQKTVDSLSDESSSLMRQANELESSIEQHYVRARYGRFHPATFQKMVIGLAIAIALLSIPIILVSANFSAEAFRAYGGLVIFVILFAAFCILVTMPRYKKVKEIENTVSFMYTKKDEISMKIHMTLKEVSDKKIKLKNYASAVKIALEDL